MDENAKLPATEVPAADARDALYAAAFHFYAHGEGDPLSAKAIVEEAWKARTEATAAALYGAIREGDEVVFRDGTDGADDRSGSGPDGKVVGGASR